MEAGRNGRAATTLPSLSAGSLASVLSMDTSFLCKPRPKQERNPGPRGCRPIFVGGDARLAAGCGERATGGGEDNKVREDGEAWPWFCWGTRDATVRYITFPETICRPVMGGRR
jgi:hypothetical protein